MSGETVLVVHSERTELTRIEGMLVARGFQVATAGGAAAARPLLERSEATVLVAPIDLLEEGSLRADGRSVVGIGVGRASDRRSALRLGIGTFLESPWADDELALACEVAGGSPGRLEPPALEGSLAHFPVADLVSMLEIHRRTGHLILEQRGRWAELRYRRGDLAAARLSTGARDEAVVEEILGWTEGTFRVDLLSEVSPFPEEDPAVRRRRQEVEALWEGVEVDPLPGSSAVSRPRTEAPSPPSPGEETRTDERSVAVHEALALANLFASYASSLAEPAVVTAKVERFRSELAESSPTLEAFEVRTDGSIATRNGGPSTGAEAIRTDVDRWLAAVSDDLASAFPGRFDPNLHRALSSVVRGESPT